MPFSTNYPPVPFNPYSLLSSPSGWYSGPSGAYGANTAQTGLALLPGPSAQQIYIQNTAAQALLYVSFGAPVASNQYHVVIPASGAPFTSSFVQYPVYVSGGSFIAWWG